MAEKVYPAKPTSINEGKAASGPTPFPTTKAQLYGANRPTYRPQPPPRRRHSRGCCCCFCITLTLAIITIIFLAAIAAAILYVLYRPHRPSFSVTSLKLSYLNITQSSSTINSEFDLNVTAKNPNKKLVYYYDPISISIYTTDNVNVGDGSLPSFVQETKTTTLLHTSIGTSNNGQALDSASLSSLKSSMKSSSGLPLEVRLDTKVKVKMGSLKSPNVGIRVTCVGIRVRVPSGNETATASTAGAKCRVHSRIKIWKWTF